MLWHLLPPSPPDACWYGLNHLRLAQTRADPPLAEAASLATFAVDPHAFWPTDPKLGTQSGMKWARLGGCTVKALDRHGDGRGLHLRIMPTGGRSWAFVATRNGVWTKIGLASTVSVSLALAPRLAAQMRGAMVSDGDPRALLACSDDLRVLSGKLFI